MTDSSPNPGHAGGIELAVLTQGRETRQVARSVSFVCPTVCEHRAIELCRQDLSLLCLLGLHASVPCNPAPQGRIDGAQRLP